MKSKPNPILYPLFLKIANSCPLDDTFYKYLFEDMAYGYFPYGLYIDDNYLICIRKNKEFSLRLTEEDKTYEQIQTLLKDKANILSEKEKLKKKQILFTKKNKEDLYKKKSYMMVMLDNYIIHEGNNNKLSIQTLQKLKKFISNCLLFKILSFSKDFEIDQDSNVVGIDGIQFEEERIRINARLLLQNMKFDTNLNFVKANEYDFKVVCSIQDVWDTYIA